MLSGANALFSFDARSPASRLDARFKLASAVAIAIGTLFASELEQLATIAVLLGVLAILSRIPLAVAWNSIRPILLFMVIGGSLLAFSTAGKGWSIGFVHVSHAGLLLGARLSLQLLLLLMDTTLLTFTTSPFALADALGRVLSPLRRVNLPVDDVTTMLTLAITFVPIMNREVDRQLTARAARGATIRRLGMWSLLGDLLVPLIHSNLDRGEELAMALDTRLYGYSRRTHMQRADVDRVASWAVVVGVVACIAAGLVFA